MKLIQMRKRFSLVTVLLALWGFKATAQAPPNLQIAITNGTATVSSQISPLAFFGELETTTNLSPPAVWSGTPSSILVSSVSSNFPVANSQTFFRLVQRWPVFEFAIFYNLNLEMDPGGAMFINGPVFSNAGIWAGSGRLTFNSTVSAIGLANISDTDPFAIGRTDDSAPPNFNLAGQPTHGNAPLTMPVAGTTNVEAMLNIPPPSFGMGTAAAYSTNGLTYLANAVDLVVSNAFYGTNVLSGALKGTNITIYFQDPINAIILKKLPNDFYLLKTGGSTNYVSPNLSAGKDAYTNVQYAGWSFVTNVAFYDYRESKIVQAVQIDVAKLNSWLTNNAVNGGDQYNYQCILDKGHTIDCVWIYNSVLLTATTLPAVRLVNGKQLANSWGFTVVTPMPIYAYGDYNKQIDSTHVSSGTNTAYTYPAALMGDAITILSGNWSDANTASTSLSSRLASDTTVNAAILEGIVPSNFSGNYSGGVENFLRYLENWGGNTSTYNGSIVVMFPSIYATNYWIPPGTYYVPPTRNWGFDVNFLQQNKLPPLTPLVVNFVNP